ncbi:hypothetical protein BKA64DRAFT_247875 [Cadophora sp. MPI-SDFR-AT-0126]|nr:hypothetical protein BKA64DRAFT_247875 [Leotiomycetes sp. MPI-SDFR-AT-0126]
MFPEPGCSTAPKIPKPKTFKHSLARSPLARARVFHPFPLLPLDEVPHRGRSNDEREESHAFQLCYTHKNKAQELCLGCSLLARESGGVGTEALNQSRTGSFARLSVYDVAVVAEVFGATCIAYVRRSNSVLAIRKTDQRRRSCSLLWHYLSLQALFPREQQDMGNYIICHLTRSLLALKNPRNPRFAKAKGAKISCGPQCLFSSPPSSACSSSKSLPIPPSSHPKSTLSSSTQLPQIHLYNRPWGPTATKKKVVQVLKILKSTNLPLPQLQSRLRRPLLQSRLQRPLLQSLIPGLGLRQGGGLEVWLWG